MVVENNQPNPYLTADLPGTGGVLKESPEDFRVEEVPLYEFSGGGDFVYLLVECVNLSTMEMVRRFRRHLGLQDHEVGVAGWKDKRAVTRQWLSLPAGKAAAAALQRLEGEGLRVLARQRHPHKLRTGHLAGNRFTIRIRQVVPGAAARAAAIVERLRLHGLPNFYGPQRFGRRGENVARGLALLRGEARVKSARLRKLLVSSCTSYLFNLTLQRRMELGLYGRLLRGDIAKKHDTGGLFVVALPEAEQERVARLEISATGPIWGKKMMQPQDEAAALEAKILAEQGLIPETFFKYPGSRRPLRVPLGEVKIEPAAGDLRLEFFLPKGSYATVFLAEIMKA